MKSNLPETLNQSRTDDLYFLGAVQAMQAMATVLLDTEEKRSATRSILDALAEQALHSPLTEDRKASYLEGISALGVAMSARKPPENS